MGRLITWMLSKLAAFQFWLATKRFKVDRDYVIERGVEDIIRIRILRGKFTGVAFIFHNIRLGVHDEAILDFETHIQENPHNADLASPKFNKLISNIFRSLLREVLHETGRNYPSESDQEREFYEESDPVLEKRILRRESRQKAIRTDTESHNGV